MPIRPEMRELYPRDWPEISRRVRFERAGGVCQGCGRPHGVTVRCLPDGRWFDTSCRTWRNGRGRMARWPDLVETAQVRHTRVLPFRLDTTRTNAQRLHVLDPQLASATPILEWQKMDLWIPAHCAEDGAAAPLTMGYLARADLPYYHALADVFTISPMDCERSRTQFSSKIRSAQLIDAVYAEV